MLNIPEALYFLSVQLKLISYNFKLSPSETGSFAVIYLRLQSAAECIVREYQESSTLTYHPVSE